MLLDSNSATGSPLGRIFLGADILFSLAETSHSDSIDSLLTTAFTRFPWQGEWEIGRLVGRSHER